MDPSITDTFRQAGERIGEWLNVTEAAAIVGVAFLFFILLGAIEANRRLGKIQRLLEDQLDFHQDVHEEGDGELDATESQESVVTR